MTAAGNEHADAAWEPLLQALRDELAALSTALSGENAAVRDFDADLLEKVLSDKTSSLRALEKLDLARRERLSALGLTDTRASIEHMSAGSATAGATWDEIEQLTLSVRLAMEANAALLHVHQRLAADALAALYADQGEPALYENGACLHAPAPARSLGRV